MLISIQADTNLLEDVPPVYISVHHLKKTGNNDCGVENNIKKCWSSTATYEYRFKGVKVQVLGTNDPGHYNYDVYIDNQFIRTVN